MRINVYSDKFSGTLSADEVLKTVRSVFKDVDIQANYFPVTDGGEHSTQILKHYNMKTEMIIMTRDFIGNSIPVEYLNVDNDIYFESASLIGVNKTSDHPFNLDTSALAEVIPKIDVLSLGGSRTVDGGVGLMSSLGIEFYTEENIITNPKPRDFKDITAVKIADSFANLELRVLTDTSIPLLGGNSAVATYGPQKGLDKKDIKYLEEQLERIYDILSLELGIPLDPFKKDTGAAGGLSFALGEIFGCELISGSEYFLEKTNLLKKIKQSEITIVCEGKFDKSSLSGKVIGEILKHATGDIYFLGGQYDYVDDHQFTGIFECGPKGLKHPKEELRNTTKKLAKQISI